MLCQVIMLGSSKSAVGGIQAKGHMRYIRTEFKGQCTRMGGRGVAHFGRSGWSRRWIDRNGGTYSSRAESSKAAADEEVALNAVSEEEVDAEEDIWSQRKHLHIKTNFLERDLAYSLRKTFDDKFEDPKKTHSARFVWDYWHLPDQYTHLRTSAADYFPEDIYQNLEDSLLNFGEQMLGCRAITPIWLSCYVEGCYQGVHADSPHGPWAFVLSLTNFDKKRFTGGETTILQPHILEYWRTFDPAAGLLSPDIVDKVEPHFNQLTVFDPRLPHGVSTVHGTHDPREGRLVLHGWFAEPSPFCTGALDTDVVHTHLSECLQNINNDLQTMPPAIGTLSIRLHVTAEGEVHSIDWLTDTLVPIPGAPVLALDGACVEPPEDARALILEVIVENIAKLTFPAAAAETEITIPFLFE